MAPVKLSELVSAESSIELQKHQNSFAQGLNLKIKATVEEVVKSTEKLNVQNAPGKRAILSQCNSFVENLGTIIYDLQTFVIYLGEKIINKKELMKLIGKFVETSYSVQHSFGLNAEDLKLIFIQSLQDTHVEASDLLKIIENEKLHENKHKLIDVLSNLLRAVDYLHTYNKILSSPFGQIKELFDKCNDGIQALMDIIQDDNSEIVLYHLIHSLNIGCQNMEKVVHYLKAYACQSKYDAMVQKMLIETSTEVHHLVSNLQNLAYKSDEIKPLEELTRKTSSRCSSILGGLENLLQNNDVVEDLKEIVYVACSNSLANGDQFLMVKKLVS